MGTDGVATGSADPQGQPAPPGPPGDSRARAPARGRSTNPQAAAPSRRRAVARRTRASAARFRRQVRNGQAIGRIAIDRIGVRFVVVEGTSATSLRRGPAHYPETTLPGGSGTVAIAGHRTTYLAPFRRLDELRRGHRIEVTMPYGRFSYAVERTRIVPPEALGVLARTSRERLVLTACHPLHSARQRIVVSARLVASANRGRRALTSASAAG